MDSYETNRKSEIMIRNWIQKYKRKKIQEEIENVRQSLPEDVVLTGGKVILTPLPPFVKVVIKFKFVNE